MPLIVPGVTDGTKPEDLVQSWMSKVSGKKIGDATNETTFAKTELPKEHRVLKQGDMQTMDFRQNRLNFHVDDDNVVKKVTSG